MACTQGLFLYRTPLLKESTNLSRGFRNFTAVQQFSTDPVAFRPPFTKMLNKRWSQQSYCSLSSPPPFEGPSSIREQRFEAASADGEYCIGKVNDLVGRCFEWRQRRQICSPSRRGQAHRNQLDEERDALIKEVSSLAQSFSISANPSGHVESYELIDKVKSQLTIPGENRSGAMQEMIHFYGKPEGTVVEQIENLKPIRYQLALAEVAIRLLHVDQLCLWTYLQEPVQIIQKWRHSALVREHAIRVSKRPGDWGGYEVTSLACVDAERLLEQTDDWATALDIEDDLTDDHKIALQNALKRQM